MDAVISRDGTSIAWHKSGTGPPLVLVAGMGAANPLAWPAASALKKRFTLYAVDRRGRGASGDSAEYALAREFEDIAAVLDSLREPAAMLGHSFGGLCALGAALLARNLSKLVLYEPAVPLPGRPRFREADIASLERLIAAGRRSEALVQYYLAAGLSDAQVEALTVSTAWPERLMTVHALPREMRAVNAYQPADMQTESLSVQALILRGMQEAADYLIPQIGENWQVERLAGLPNLAMYTAPDLFARTVTAFLLD